jgi:hypothetical protein
MAVNEPVGDNAAQGCEDAHDPDLRLEMHSDEDR